MMMMMVMTATIMKMILRSFLMMRTTAITIKKAISGFLSYLPNMGIKCAKNSFLSYLWSIRLLFLESASFFTYNRYVKP